LSENWLPKLTAMPITAAAATSQAASTVRRWSKHQPASLAKVASRAGPDAGAGLLFTSDEYSREIHAS
jgi:hypothetical protein